MKVRSILLGAAASLLIAGTAAADIIVYDTPPYPPNPDENVLFDQDLVVGDNILTGHTNQTNSAVRFTSNEGIVAPPQGQARVEAVDGGMTFLSGELASGLGFGMLEFNINALADGMVTLAFMDNFGELFTHDYSVGGSGSNFFSIQAVNNELITNFSIAASGNTVIEDVAQVRLGGVTSLGAVPEPATWLMMILGFGMVGAGMRMRRKEELLAVS